jgi:hypothetical protein
MTKEELIKQLEIYDVKEKDWAICLPTSFDCCSVFLLEALVEKAISIFGEDYATIYNYSPEEEEKRILKQIISDILTPESTDWEILIGDGENINTSPLNQIKVMTLPDILYVGNQIQICSTKGVSTVIEIETEVDVNMIATGILESFDAYERVNYK